MDTQALKQKKTELDKAIANLIYAFQNETGLMITAVAVTPVRMSGGNSVQVSSKAELEA